MPSISGPPILQVENTSGTTVVGATGIIQFTGGTVTGSGNKAVVSTSGGGGGANTALSNLAAVQINSDLVFGSTQPGVVQTNNETTLPTKNIFFESGNTTNAGSVSGNVIITSGTATSGNTGSANFSSGASASGNSGNVNISSGTGTATGNINIQSSNAGTATSGSINLITGGQTNVNPTGAILLTTGSNASGPTGQIILTTGSSNNAANPTAKVIIQTGANTAAGGSSGNIQITTGTASSATTQGDLVITCREVNITALAVLLPVQTTDPVSVTTAGAIYYNSTSNTIRWYNGTSWASLL